MEFLVVALLSFHPRVSVLSMNNKYIHTDSKSAKKKWLDKLNVFNTSKNESFIEQTDNIDKIKELNDEDAKKAWLARLYKPPISEEEENAKKEWLKRLGN